MQIGFGQVLDEKFDYTNDDAVQAEDDGGWVYGDNLQPVLTSTDSSDSGTKCIELTNGNNLRKGFIQKDVTLEAGALYTISLKYKKSDNATKAGRSRINITNKNNNSDTSGDNDAPSSAKTNWQDHTFDFTATDGGDYDFKIVEKTISNEKGIYVDEIKIVKVVQFTISTTNTECAISNNETESTYKIDLAYLQ